MYEAAKCNCSGTISFSVRHSHHWQQTNSIFLPSSYLISFNDIKIHFLHNLHQNYPGCRLPADCFLYIKGALQKLHFAIFWWFFCCCCCAFWVFVFVFFGLKIVMSCNFLCGVARSCKDCCEELVFVCLCVCVVACCFFSPIHDSLHTDWGVKNQPRNKKMNNWQDLSFIKN